MRRFLLVACLALGGCTTSPPEEDSTGATTAPPATGTLSTPAEGPTLEPECPNQEAVVADDSLRTGETASGDVDGDGSEEDVALFFDPAGEPGCQAFVVAGPLAGPLGSWRSDLGLPMPTLNTLTDVDDEPGAEIVVNMGIGASTQFVGIVVEADGALVQVASDEADAPAEGLFAFGGSVGHVEAVDCAPGGGIVTSFAAPQGERYEVERRFLVFRGTTLVEERTDVRTTALEDIDRFPEYRASPFGSCSG